MISKPHRLHPAAIIFYLYKEVKSLALPIVIALVAIFRGSLLNMVLGIGVTLILIVGYCLLKYFTFSYQLLDHEILVKSGVFVKKVNHVPYDRIQNITSNQWFFLKPFSLEELEIETAGHSEGPEVSLSAVSVELKNELNNYRQQVDTETESKNVSRETFSGESYSITWKELLKFSLTSPAFLSGLLVILAAYGKIQNVVNKQVYKFAAAEMQHLGILIVIAGFIFVLLLFYIISVLSLIAKYYHFNLVKNSNQFQMKYGFFKTKKTTISMNRVQAVVVKQTLLRRLLNIASVKLVIISNSKKEDTEKDIIVMPVIEKANLESFLGKFFPNIPISKLEVKKVSSKTYYYDLRNAIIISVLVDVVLGIMAYKITWLLAVIILISGLIFVGPAYLKARRSGLAIMDKHFLYLQNNQFFSKNTYFIPRESIQLIERRQSVWLAKNSFAHLRLNCRSGNGERIIAVKYLPEEVIDEVVDWY